jgi:hypothetical protein
VVWRCADKVENDKNSMCKNNHTITDIEIKQYLCNKLNINECDEDSIKQNVEAVFIMPNGIEIYFKDQQVYDTISL